jgi:5-hydroxyisourate hydrolase
MAQASYLSTHILNTARGGPAVSVAIKLWRLEPAPVLLARTITDQDGRAIDPLLPEDSFILGRYELRFHVGAYFHAQGLAADPGYLDVVPVRVTLAAGQGALPRPAALLALELHDLSRLMIPAALQALHPETGALHGQVKGISGGGDGRRYHDRGRAPRRGSGAGRARRR